MNKLHLGWILVLFLVCFSACTKKEYIIVQQEQEQNPEQEQEQEQPDNSTYTIMLYGCGGSNLDKEMILNIQEALIQGTTDRVKFTGQVKFSKRFQSTEEFYGTQRFIVGPTNGLWYDPVEVFDENVKLYDPQNLTDFINWSKKQCPADEYILLLWNHGSAWTPVFDAPEGRAIIHDDVLGNEALTLDDFVKGVKDSGTKLKMIYYDACLMGMMEVVTGIRECADYVMCASHVTPSMGGDYNSLIYHLDNSSNFENAIKEYISEVISHWDNQGMPLDLKLINLGKMDKLLTDVKVFSGYMEDVAKITSKVVTDYENGVELQPLDDNVVIASTYQSALNKCYTYGWFYNGIVPDYPFYDIHMLAELLANGSTNSYTSRFVNIASRINRSFKEVIVCKQATSVAHRWDFTMGTTIVSKDVWTKLGYDKAYKGLEYDKLTNWGKWLSINPIQPVGNPDPSDMMDNVGSDEEEDGVVRPNFTLEDEIQQLLQLIGRR